jgi:signal transduction histidine kinase
MVTRGVLAAHISKRAPLAYAAASTAVAIALAARWGLAPFLGLEFPYLTLFPAIVFAALYCGTGPSLVALLVGIAGAKYWFVTPLHSMQIFNRTDLIGMLVFAVVCCLIVAIGEAHLRNRQSLLEAQGNLEERVQQRTTEVNAANQRLRHLTARLLELQDEERRRFARELHDSAGQTLTALAMNLSVVQNEIERLTKSVSTVQDSAALVQDLSKEIRTISHLLHPPLLDEAGLASAVRWYVEGFVERSGIAVDLQIPDEFARLTRESEITIFRIIQECLTNIHRHSGSPSAKVRIVRTAHDVRVEIADKGKGISPEKQVKMESPALPGVGIGGMRERLRQLGGSLEIKCGENPTGTQVIARLPVAESSNTVAA